MAHAAPLSPTPLQWLEDLDGDGRPELIIWSSFGLEPEALPINSGLVAWAYEADPAGRFVIDWAATRGLATMLASLYDQPPESTLVRPQGRSAAALALEALARGACGPRRTGRRQRQW